MLFDPVSIVAETPTLGHRNPKTWDWTPCVKRTITGIVGHGCEVLPRSTLPLFTQSDDKDDEEGDFESHTTPPPLSFYSFRALVDLCDERLLAGASYHLVARLEKTGTHYLSHHLGGSLYPFDHIPFIAVCCTRHCAWTITLWHEVRVQRQLRSTTMRGRFLDQSAVVGSLRTHRMERSCRRQAVDRWVWKLSTDSRCKCLLIPQ